MAKNISESINDKVAHILYVSSDAVYGARTFNVDEKSQLAPDSFYGEMHLAREKVFENFKDRIGILRPTLVFGKNDPHNAYGPNRFLRSALERNEITIFGKESKKIKVRFLKNRNCFKAEWAEPPLYIHNLFTIRSWKKHFEWI